MWIGRLDLTVPRTGWRVLGTALAVAAAAEVASRVIVSQLIARPVNGIDAETAQFLFGTESIPALPLFLLAAGGLATAVVAACALAGSRWPGRAWTPFASAGQMALTWYFAHIVIGLGTLVALDVVGTKPLPVAAGYGVVFFTAAVLLSWVWKSFFRHGPLEWVMRNVAG
jgi:uncharacterized membrane protein YeiB